VVTLSQARGLNRVIGIGALTALQAQLHAREERLREEVLSLQTTEEQARTTVSRLQSRVDAASQRSSELTSIRANLNDNVSRIQSAIDRQSSETASSGVLEGDTELEELQQHIDTLKVRLH